MYNGQQTTGGAETDHGISGFFVSTRILQNEQGVIKDGHCLFECDTVLGQVLRGLCFVPFKGCTTMLKDPVHGDLEYHSVFTM
jgi:hypothetical protein